MARRRAPNSTQTYSPAHTQRGRMKKCATNGDDPDANAESQRLRVLGALLGKPNEGGKEMEQFRTKVLTAQHALRAVLKQRSQQATQGDSTRRSEVTSVILKALQTPDQRPQHNVMAISGTRIAANRTLIATKKVGRTCRDLICEYKAFEKMITDMGGDKESRVVESYIGDMNEAKRRLRLGHKVALRNVKKVLGAVDGEYALGAEDDQMAEVGNEKAGINLGLLKSLRYAERGVKRMVKAIPTDQ